MRVTRRYWTSVILGAMLAISAPILETPVLLLGAALLWGWLLACQYAFVRASDRAFETLDVTVEIADSTVLTDEETEVTVDARVDRYPEVDLSLTTLISVGATDLSPDARTLSLPNGEVATTEFLVEWPIAGTFEVGPVEATVADRYGLFGRRFTVDAVESVSVVPRRPRNVHVGEGTNQVSLVTGEHDTDRPGGGMELLEIREYVPGDEVQEIDWKATARLREVHIREFEGKTSRTTLVVFDHRSRLDIGPPGATELEYLRHVGLAFVDGTAEFNDPIGFVGVGDGGTSVVQSPSADHRAYERVKSLLRELTASDASSESDDTRDRTRALQGASSGSAYYRSSEAARAAANRLSNEDTELARRLVPFFDRPSAYAQQIDEDPLFRSIENIIKTQSGAVWTVIMTDDEGRRELYEAVKAARRGGNHVIVFLTPSVLFGQDDIGRLDEIYERYSTFEEFRRRLHRMDRVSALEVAPGDRLEAVLDAGRRPDEGHPESATESQEVTQPR